MTSIDGDYFESLLKQHVTSKRAKLPVPTAPPIYGPLKLILQNPPPGFRRKRIIREDEERLFALERENQILKRQVTELQAELEQWREGAGSKG